MSEDDRPHRSWREIDQLRDGTARRDERRPGGKAAEARAQAAAQKYIKEIDKIFSNDPGGEEGSRLAAALRDAHGTPELPAVCRSYREAIGLPVDPSLLGLFLDTGESELVVQALEALLALQRGGRLEASKGLRSQLRVLEQDFDNAIAEVAEDLLAEL